MAVCDGTACSWFYASMVVCVVVVAVHVAIYVWWLNKQAKYTRRYSARALNKEPYNLA